MRFVLATWNLANSITTKTLWHEMSMWCVYLYMYIQRVLRVACSVVRAMREPQVAEQQQCSPAFFMRVGERVKLFGVCRKSNKE